MTTRFNPEVSIIKANLVKAITDKNNNLGAISYLRPDEIEYIALLEAFVQEQARLTEYLKVPPNILDDFVFNFKDNRQSINGFRSEQLVQILNTKATEAEKKANEGGLQ